MRRNSHGYTLLEILLAISVLSLGSLFVFPAFMKSADLLANVSSRYHALILADNLLAKSQKDLYTFGLLPETAENGTRMLNGRRYQYKMNFVKLDPMRTLYEIVLEIRWGDPGEYRMSRVSYAIR